MFWLVVPLVASLAQAEPLQLILNDPLDKTGPTDACEAEVCTALVARLDAATTRIDFALYGLRNQTHIVDALKRAKERGVEVRGVVDRIEH